MRWLLPLLVLTIIAAACGGSGNTNRTSQPPPDHPDPAHHLTHRHADAARLHLHDAGAGHAARGRSDRHPLADGTLPPSTIPDDAAVLPSRSATRSTTVAARTKASSHPLFAQYLSQQLNRPVVWVSLAGNGTLQDFLHTGSPTQLERAEELLASWHSEGRDVVAITLSIGGNDLLELGSRLRRAPPSARRFFRISSTRISTTCSACTSG